jgi:hypothetical protein
VGRLLTLKSLPADTDRAEHRDPAVLMGALAGVAGFGFVGLSLSQGIGIVSGAVMGMAILPLRPVQPRATAGPGDVMFGWTPAFTGTFAALLLVILGSFLAMQSPTADVSSSNQAIANLLGTGKMATGGPLRVISVADAFSGEEAFGTIRMQAEACTKLELPFTRKTRSDAEGGAFLEIEDRAGKGTGAVTYLVDVPVSGRYIFSARVQWQDGCGNSVAFAAGGSRVIIASDVYGRWHILESPRILELKAGPQEVAILNTEDGVRIDSWSLQYRLEN